MDNGLFVREGKDFLETKLFLIHISNMMLSHLNLSYDTSLNIYMILLLLLYIDSTLTMT